MPLMIQVGQTGTLRFLPEMAGLDAALVEETMWQMQGAPQACDLIPPDQVKGLAPGTQNFRCKTTMATGDESLTYRFEVQCTVAGPPGPPKVIPVALDITPPGVPSLPLTITPPAP